LKGKNRSITSPAFAGCQSTSVIVFLEMRTRSSLKILNFKFSQNIPQTMSSEENIEPLSTDNVDDSPTEPETPLEVSF
jgi:hypothetical protein